MASSLATPVGRPFAALTSRTITEPKDLRAELAAVRQRGYALHEEDVAEGLYCVAVPIPEGREA